MSPRDFVFLNYSEETFTSSASGAIATYIWECCKSAADIEPLVVSRGAPQNPHAWERLITIPYPAVPHGEVGSFAVRVQRNLNGVPRLGMKTWARRAARVIEREAGADATVLLQNDPEVLVMLRRLLPRARLAILFQNQQGARLPFRTQLGQAADAVAAVSDFTAAWIADHYGLHRSTVQTIYSGVDSTAFRPPERRDGPPVLGFVGRTGIEKGPDLMLAAALKVAERTTDFGVQVVGSNHWDRFEHDAYQQRLTDLGARLRERGIEVSTPGHVGRADLPRYLQKSSIHVVPSMWDEPFGLTTLEGMAAGNATLASATGGTPEVVGDAGQLFARGDADQLAALMLDLIEQPRLRAEWSAKARARALRFPWSATFDSLRTLTGAR